MKKHQDTARYELVRALSPREFAGLVFAAMELHEASESYEEAFDELVDNMVVDKKAEKKCRGKCK